MQPAVTWGEVPCFEKPCSFGETHQKREDWDEAVAVLRAIFRFTARLLCFAVLFTAVFMDCLKIRLERIVLIFFYLDKNGWDLIEWEEVKPNGALGHRLSVGASFFPCMLLWRALKGCKGNYLASHFSFFHFYECQSCVMPSLLSYSFASSVSFSMLVISCLGWI